MTPNEAQDQIIKDFKNLKTWIDKYQYLVKIGKTLPAMDDEFKTEQYLIKGCQLKTWFYSTFEGETITYTIDSSSAIIKGAIVLLKKIFSDQRPIDIQNTDLYFVERVGLQEIFSPIRANSLWKIGNKMKQDALAALTQK